MNDKKTVSIQKMKDEGKDYYWSDQKKKYFQGYSSNNQDVNFNHLGVKINLPSSMVKPKRKKKKQKPSKFEPIDPIEYKKKQIQYHYSRKSKKFYVGYSDIIGDINFSKANRFRGSEVKSLKIIEGKKRKRRLNKLKQQQRRRLIQEQQRNRNSVIYQNPVEDFIDWILGKSKKPQHEINQDEQPTVGTGFFINEKGYVVTNYHVVGDEKKLRMAIKGKEYVGRVIAIDGQNDLAVIKTSQKNKDYFKFSHEDTTRMDTVIAAGFGFGKTISNEAKTTQGVVSALSGSNNNYSQIQVDAPLQPGNSGGPVFNRNGSVIGVAVAKIISESAEGISFAIKISTVKQFLSSNKIKFHEEGESERTKKEINDLIDKAVLFITPYT